MRLLIVVLVKIIFVNLLNGQNLLDDFLINSTTENVNGLGRTSIAAHSNGNFAVAWQDYNDYNIPIAEQPRIAVQLFSNDGNRIGQTNLFNGESRGLSIWTSDFLDENSDLAFTPNGTLLLAVEHEGRFSIGSDDVGSSEVGIAAISNSGEAIDLSNDNGIISWLISTETKWQEHPRISVGNNGSFILIADGATYTSNKRAVLAQLYDSNGDFVGNLFTPHINDPNPESNHRDPDVATNGSVTVIVWQDGRNGNDWDISAQFYSSTESLGGNIIVNSGDPGGTLNVLPSVDINSSGESVVVWLDTRENVNGEVYAQRFSSTGQRIGNNIKVSSSSGTILDRPEIAILDDGSFMVVWSDNITNGTDISGYRALGKQFNPDGTSASEIFIIPNIDVPSGFVNIASNGQAYFCSWLDDRLNASYLNLYAKKILPLATSVSPNIDHLPTNYSLEQNYPNPFNPATRMKINIPEESDVKLDVYNNLGQHVETIANKVYDAGSYYAIWDGLMNTSGVYLLRFTARSLVTGEIFSDTKRMLLLK